MGDGRAATDARDVDAFGELRTLLVGEERDQLRSILTRLEDHEARRHEIGALLPGVLLEHAADPRLTSALTPPVERAITASVRRNPAPLADALFPVMGPAIRKAVAAALSGMIESLNRTLDHSLSWRSLLWRLEALRTGRSFAEIMLLRTLVYRVEQVFLIERTSGLLLQHVTQGAGEVKDADMVSGMLTAIRDFVKDSFRVDDGEALDALTVGELSVWIEQGPSAIVAAVIRGTPPPALRAALQQALERVHLEFGDEFEHFRGDSAAFEPARPLLDACLHSEYRAGAGSNHRTLILAAAAVAIAVAVWAGFSLRARSRWNAYVDALRAEPGIVVVASGRQSGKYVVSGLRDPLARDPHTLLAAASLTDAEVNSQWQMYYAATPAIALARARLVLQPPPGVALDLKDGVLSASGTIPLAWIDDAARLAPLIPGITSVSGASDAALAAAIAGVEALSPLFVKGQAVLAPGQDDVLRQLVERAGDLGRRAGRGGKRFRLEVVGHTDADGADQANLPLSRARAALVRAALEPAAGGSLELSADGVGSGDPVVRSNREADKQRNRRVTVRVVPAGSDRR